MNRPEVRNNVAEYRRRSKLVREFRARQRALRVSAGQRGSSTGLQHSIAMNEILKQLSDGRQPMLAQLLKDWHGYLERAAQGHTPLDCRAAARRLAQRINELVEEVPLRGSR